MDEFLSENPDADAASLCSRFGAPGDVAVSCLENIDSRKLLRMLHIRNRICRLVFLFAVLALLVWSAFVYDAYRDFMEDKYEGYGVVEIIEYSDANMPSKINENDGTMQNKE